MSYKAEFSDDGGRSFATNGLRFATEAEALQYARDLFSRWMAATDYRTAESEDAINYEIADGEMRRIA